ncbi:MAG: hypothetical protein NT023_25520 [Armatimonadetes bacterium]|nr:hypothetical protein [Armatimonadota bacterium]
MAEAILLEGTWEELLSHAEELRGKRLRITVLPNAASPLNRNEEPPSLSMTDFLSDFIGCVEGSGANNSEEIGVKYAAHLVEKHREGHL